VLCEGVDSRQVCDALLPPPDASLLVANAADLATRGNAELRRPIKALMSASMPLKEFQEALRLAEEAEAERVEGGVPVALPPAADAPAPEAL
jgi:hypothetical protein